MVGRRGEAPLVPPYILPSIKKALALSHGHMTQSSSDTARCVQCP